MFPQKNNLVVPLVVIVGFHWPIYITIYSYKHNKLRVSLAK
jgi:hypothetical protein